MFITLFINIELHSMYNKSNAIVVVLNINDRNHFVRKLFSLIFIIIIMRDFKLALTKEVKIVGK